MKKIIKITLLCMSLAVLLSACRTTEATDNSDKLGLHATNQKDDAIKTIMDNPDLSEKLKKEIIELLILAIFPIQ